MSESNPSSLFENKVDEKYELNDVLGEGTYGVVYKAKNINNNKIVAIKKIRLE